MVLRTKRINHAIIMNYFESIHGLPCVVHAHTANTHAIESDSFQTWRSRNGIRASFHALSLFLTQISDTLMGMCKIESTVQ